VLDKTGVPSGNRTLDQSPLAWQKESTIMTDILEVRSATMSAEEARNLVQRIQRQMADTRTLIPVQTFRRAYRFRMRPNQLQEQILCRNANACRWVWNWALSRRKEYYEEHGKTITVNQLCAELTAINRPRQSP
jgi:hypothetical protein